MFEMLLIMVIGLVVCGFVLGITPYITRRNIHFGVMLPDEAGELSIIKKWKRQFLIGAMALSLGGTLSLFMISLLNLDDATLENYIAIIGSVMIIVLVILQFVMYFYFHRQAKQLKIEKFSNDNVHHDARIMVSTNFRNEKMTVSNGWLITLGGLIILVTALVPALLYDQIPALIPNHWGSSGQATSWAPKSPHIFAIAPIIQLALLSIFIFVNYTLRVTKQMISPKDAKTSIKQNRAYRYAMSKMMLIIGLSSLLLLTIPQFLMVFGISNNSGFSWVVMAYLVVVLGSVIYTSLKYGQGGERYKQTTDTENDYQMLDDDDFWKWGMFYYNQNDPAIFVEKRFGIGITLNFARWQAWAYTIGTFAIIGFITIVAMILEG